MGGGGGAAASRSIFDDEDEDEEESRSRKFVPWSERKTAIMQTFTTTGSIQMPSFVSKEVAQVRFPSSLPVQPAGG